MVDTRETIDSLETIVERIAIKILLRDTVAWVDTPTLSWPVQLVWSDRQSYLFSVCWGGAV